MSAPAPPGNASDPVYAIDVQGLNKHFGTKHVVNDVTMRVQRGEIFGFLGPNGSGKTTCIRMMCGLLTPDSGSGTCLGYDIVRDSAQIKRRTGYMTQRFSYWEDLTIRENLDFVARIYEMKNPPGGGRSRARTAWPSKPCEAVGRRTVGRMEAASRAGRVHAP
ncbi:ABC-type multidrug transport system ATPase subunit [Paraburkholderia sp. RAU6.4a]